MRGDSANRTSAFAVAAAPSSPTLGKRWWPDPAAHCGQERFCLNTLRCQSRSNRAEGTRQLDLHARTTCSCWRTSPLLGSWSSIATLGSGTRLPPVSARAAAGQSLAATIPGAGLCIDPWFNVGLPVSRTSSCRDLAEGSCWPAGCHTQLKCGFIWRPRQRPGSRTHTWVLAAAMRLEGSERTLVKGGSGPTGTRHTLG